MLTHQIWALPREIPQIHRLMARINYRSDWARFNIENHYDRLAPSAARFNGNEALSRFGGRFLFTLFLVFRYNDFIVTKTLTSEMRSLNLFSSHARKTHGRFIVKEALKNVWISRTPSLLSINWRRRMLSSGCLGETFLFLLGFAFLAIPLFSLLAAMSRAQYSFKWSDLLVLPFILLGGLLVSRTLTLLTNTDRVEVTPQELKIRSGPLPAWDATRCTLPVSTIQSVEAKNIASRSGRRHAGVSISYAVLATLANGKTKTLVGGFHKAEPIYYIANEISSFLTSLHPSN